MPRSFLLTRKKLSLLTRSKDWQIFRIEKDRQVAGSQQFVFIDNIVCWANDVKVTRTGEQDKSTDPLC